MIIFIFSLIAIVAGVYVVTNWTRETQVVVQDRKPVVIKETTYYKSYCWKCGKDIVIDSRNNRLCSKCRKYYVCNKCGKCLCDKRDVVIEEKPKSVKKHWELSEVKNSKATYSGNTCSICGKKLTGDKNHRLCIDCYRKVTYSKESKTNYSGNTCNICGKKLPGDKKRRLCIDCYRKVTYSKESSGNSDGYCQKCGKKLRGDTTKKICTACWRNGKTNNT